MDNNEKYRQHRNIYNEPETEKLPLPSKEGPFSGHRVKGNYWGQDVHRIGESGPVKAPVYGEKVAKKYFSRDFDIALGMEHDRLIAVTGPEGYGKSTLAIHIARAADPDLTVDNIIFGRKTLKNRLQNAEKGETIIVDEAGIELFSQEWYAKVQRDIITELVKDRIKGYRIFFVSPHKNMLNKQIRERRVDGWFYTQKLGRYERGLAQYRESIENPYDMRIFWAPRFSVKFGGIDDDFWDDYLEKKQNYVSTASRDEEVGGNELDKLKTAHILREKGWSSQEVSEVMTVGASRVRDLWSRLDNNEDLKQEVEEA